MKTKKKYIDRLTTLANYLAKTKAHFEFGLYETANLVEIKTIPHVTTPLVFHYWIVEDLPTIFCEWYYHEKFGDPLFKGCSVEEGTMNAVVEFFDLTLEETLHLFDLEGKQNVEKFGGVQLNFESDGPELAKNIFDLIERKMTT